MPEQSQCSGSFPRDWAVSITSRRRCSARSQSGHTLGSQVPVHHRPPPKLLARSVTLSHRMAAHRCPAGNPKAAGCLDTECWLPPGPPAHSCLRKVEALTPRAAGTHGARAPLGTGHSWKQSRAQGWETLPLTCPKAAERCARGTTAQCGCFWQGGKAAWRLVRESARDALTCSQGPPRQRWHFSRLDTQGLTSEDSGPEQGSSANVASLSPEHRTLDPDSSLTQISPSI